MAKRTDTSASLPRPPRAPRTSVWTYKTGLPEKIGTKIEKTGQTRGASPSQIYQNRVLRSSTVLIRLKDWMENIPQPSAGFENGYIVYASPEEYFAGGSLEAPGTLPSGLELGQNFLILYDKRPQLDEHPPKELGLSPALRRVAPLNGEYLVRVSGTTSKEKGAVREGLTTTGDRGAGIRAYEYASAAEVEATRLQLAFLAWRTEGIIKLASEQGEEDPSRCKMLVDKACHDQGLADVALLQRARVLNAAEAAICPLCLKPILAAKLGDLEKQAVGREVHNSTFTAVNLFHLVGLLPGQFNHKRYNLGWGHHHCNTVARDNGLQWTIDWMRDVVAWNDQAPPPPTMSGSSII